MSWLRKKKHHKTSRADSGQQVHASATNEREVTMDTPESNGKSSTSNVAPDVNPVEIIAQDPIYSVAFLADGEHVVTGGSEKKIRQWRVEDGKEVGKPMDVGSSIDDLAVTQDDKWIVCGTRSGRVIVWDATSHEKVTEFQAHDHFVNAVDVSADGTKIATGANDEKVSVWSFSDGERLLGPFKHDYLVAAVKISPDGRRVATATWNHDSVRVYDGSNLLADFPIRVGSSLNGSLAWASDSNRLFALSNDGDIHSLDVSTKNTLAKWRIHSDDSPRCIALACNDTIIAASAHSSLSFWDTKTRQQIGTDIHHSHFISSMAISPCAIATAGKNNITLRSLSDILPSPYRDMPHLEQEIRRLKIEKPDIYDVVMALRAGDARQKDDIANLEKTIQELRNQLATSNKEKESLKESSNRKITHLDESDKEFRSMLVASQGSVDRLTKTITALRADVDLPEKSSVSIAPKINELELSVQELGNQFATCKCALRVHDKKYQCETLYAEGRIYDAAQHITGAKSEHLWDNKLVIDWLKEFVHRCVSSQEIENVQSLPPEFVQRCVSKLQEIGDGASSSKNHDEALSAYSAVLSLNPSHPEGVLTGWTTNISDIIVKCCEARACLLEDELVNVTQISERDPSNYEGYKRKHALLHGLGRYKEAFEAFETMLSRMETSSDPQARDMQRCYLDATPLIRKVVEQTTRVIPHVLIDTTTGRLCDKKMQQAAFEKCSMFDQLRSSMIVRHRLDHARIQQEVQKFYEYVMFSHRWQPPEPSFQMVENTLIYGLPASRANNKLVNFCNLVKSRRFRWAWSDTCCVDQSDKGVQQESIVAMFQWYRHAALTIVHLLGVHSKSQRKGLLWESIWNTRGWTYQEYVASKVVQFYTEDWKPYLDVELFNHKESPLILSEMEQATNFATQALATLQPGLTRVREKLYLASSRETTRVEDIAYCLFGIFDVALPVIYGEGTRAVRRLLEYILTQSDNVTLLSWTHAGNSGSNAISYLPADLTVYDHIEPPHVPQPIETAEMDRMTMALQSSSLDPLLAVQLYERLHDLPPLSIMTGRLRLPGFVFSLTSLTALAVKPGSDSIVHVYHATTPILGDIRIETNDDLVGMHGLVLIHPWISPLLDRDFAGGAAEFDLAVRALRLVVRLRQPFGALLLALEGRMLYKRVATDSFIQVQIRAETPLKELMDSVRIVDVQ